MGHYTWSDCIAVIVAIIYFVEVVILFIKFPVLLVVMAVFILAVILDALKEGGAR